MGRVARVIAVLAAACLALCAACTATPPDGDRTEPSPTPTEPPVHMAELRLPDEPTSVVPEAEPAARAATMSRALFASSPVAVLAPANDVAAQVRAAAIAVALGAPLLLDPVTRADDTAPDAGEVAETDTDADRGSGAEGGEDAAAPPDAETDTDTDADTVTAELRRLGVLAVLTVGRAQAEVGDDVLVLEAPADDGDLADLLRMDLAPVEAPAAGGELAAVAVLDRDAATLPTAATPDSPQSPEPDDATPPEPTTAPDGTAVPDPATSPDETTLPDEPAALPLTTLAEPLEGALVLTADAPGDLAPVATARAAGVDVLTVPGGDPRATATTVQAFAATQPTTVIGVGPAFGDAETLAWQAATAATGVELPGGGQVLFPGRRFVAMYGTPVFAGLGILGEQDVAASVERAKGLAAEYQPLTDDVVVPAFEIIVTVASAGPGDDGNYSNEFPAETFVPWVEAARDAGVYVVIDLQPGRTDFVTQAKLYEELLRYPNVGLALDPEWRLAPDQVHLRQIGSVGVDEVNAVSAYLAELTRTHQLPQKLLVLHQFMLKMIDGRERLDLSHAELALLIHADGQGSQPAKAGTWNALHQGAPEGLAWGWKNFIDEDSPMLTPEQTYQVTPAPQFVSYQ